MGGVKPLRLVPPSPSPSRRVLADAEREELGELVMRAQAGEPAAQTGLVRRYTIRVAAFVRPIIAQPSAVDDVVQIVFIKMLRRLPALRDTAAFESWLFSLARNSALDFIRRRRCRPTTVWDEDELTNAADTNNSDQSVAEIMEALDRALQHLSPRDRNIVTMIVQGNSYRAAAASEGLSVGAVKLRLNRVRPFLRVSIGQAIGTPAMPGQKFRRPPRCSGLAA